MKKTIAALFAVVMIVAVVDVAAVAAGASTPHAKALSPTTITVTDYHKQIAGNSSYAVKGQLTSGGAGLGNKIVFPEYQYQGEWAPLGGWVTTNADGTFTDKWTFGHGTWTYQYEFAGDNQYAPCVSAPFTITAS